MRWLAFSYAAWLHNNRYGIDQLIHHVAVSFIPNWTGGEQIHVIELEGHWLTLRGIPVQVEGVNFTPMLKWKRL